jgi:Lrp/AsnC family transcriptional regulator for asnA, asnC and gidA
MMDTSDLKIIHLLLKDSRTPLSAIARELGISQPAVQKRVEKLKAAGIIMGSTAVLNTGKLGWKRAVVALNVKKAGYSALLATLAKLPLVTGVYHATGPYGIVVELLGPAAIVNGVVAHLGKMKGVAECCALSIVEKVI